MADDEPTKSDPPQKPGESGRSNNEAAPPKRHPKDSSEFPLKERSQSKPTVSTTSTKKADTTSELDEPVKDDLPAYDEDDAITSEGDQTGATPPADGQDKSEKTDPEPWRKFGNESTNVQAGPESDGSMSDQSTFFPFAEREAGEATYGLDVLIVTALAKEMRPAINVFGATRRQDPDDPAPTYEATIDTPLKKSCEVYLLCLHDMGGRATGPLSKAIDRWQPRNVIFIGIAAMNRSLENMDLGDLLIASSIVDASHIKVESNAADNQTSEDRGNQETTNTFRSETYPCDRELYRPMQDYATVQPTGYRAAVGSIISMDWLVKDAATRDSLLQLHHKSIGLEMEGHGLVNVVADTLVDRRPAIGFVKAAVDYADSEKDDSFHTIGAERAARFVHEVLRYATIPMAGRVRSIRRRAGVTGHKGDSNFDVVPVARKEIERCQSVIVLDEVTERRLDESSHAPLVAALGAPGGGRHTLGKDLLGRRHPEVYEIRNLKRLSDLSKMNWQPKTGYLVRLADHMRPTRDTISDVADALQLVGASLVIVALPAVLAGSDADDIIGEIECNGHGDGQAVLRNHIQYGASSGETMRRALQLADEQSANVDLDSLSTRRLSDASVAALKWADRHLEVDDGGLQEPLLFGDVGKARFDAASASPDDRIALLAHAAFFGSPLTTIATASDRLRSILLPDEQAKPLDPFAEPESARNARLGIRAWSRPIGLFNEQVDQKVAGVGAYQESTAVMRHAWNEYPQVQNQLTAWLIELAQNGPHNQRDAAANMLGILASESPVELLQDPIATWAASENQRLRWNAGFALSELLAKDSTSAMAAGLLEEWSDPDALEWLRCTACHAGVWASIKGYEVDSALLLQATKPPAEDWFTQRRRAGADDWGAIWELRFALWQSVLVAQDLPSGTADVFLTVGAALDRADREEEALLSRLMGIAMYLGEVNGTERDGYGSLYLLQAQSSALREAVALIAVRLIELTATSRDIGRVVQAWAWACLDHPTLADEALLMLERLWALADDFARQAIQYELRDVAQKAAKPKAIFLHIANHQDAS